MRLKWSKWGGKPGPDVSPCHETRVKGGFSTHKIIGLCGECGRIVSEYDPQRDQTRILEREEGVLSPEEVVL
jgi:hypothetical protein